MDAAIRAAAEFYDAHYDLVFERLFERSDKCDLGDRKLRKCRFCGGEPPAVTFKMVAHAIPEALGNRGLTSAYECDACNQAFGHGIENDLGEWSKPARTFSRLRGKNGVPTLKKGSDGGWRIEHTQRGFDIKSYEDDPLYELDEANKRIVFTLKRGAYIPVAVFKAFVKIALTLMPEAELGPFAEAMAWIRNPDHRASPIKQMTIVHTFQNGPMPNDRLVACILRRKAQAGPVPYAFLVLGYGNDVYQVPVPAREKDAALIGKPFTMVAFPTPGGPDPRIYGRSPPRALDLAGREVVRGETTQVAVRYATLVEVFPPGITDDLDAMLARLEGPVTADEAVHGWTADAKVSVAKYVRDKRAQVPATQLTHDPGLVRDLNALGVRNGALFDALLALNARLPAAQSPD